MKRSTRSTLVLSLFVSLIFLVSGVPMAHATSAKHWYKQGQKAEQQDNVKVAYTDYDKAYTMKPGDMRFRVAFERTRLPASALRVEHGEQLEKLGDNSGAVAEFLKAMEIDPSNELAMQDIQEIRRKVNALKGGTNSESPRTPGEAFEQLAGPIELRPISNEPLTLHMVEDSKVVYQTVCKAAGINVLFDPDYTSKRIQVDLQNTTLSDALRIIATVSDTFYQAITPNTIFVAADTRAKRAELETQAVQTFYLHNVTQQSDFTDVQTALRNVFQGAHIFGVASQNAIVMRASPSELILAQKLISDLDRAKPEVVVDVAVLEVSRNLERDIGLQLPQTASINLQAATSSTSNSSGSGTTPTTSSGLTLNNLAHLNSNDFAVTIGSAQAELLLTDTNTQVIQEPRIRASDGQDATLKIGERLPVATGSYQTGAATAIVSSLVNTQFQYLDVGVNIDITPTVLYDRDVSMKVKITISSTDGTEDLGGVDEPIITQRVANETVRLKNGEANLIGGIKQVQVSNAISGTPGLAELPLLKYIFGTRDHTVAKDDLVVLLIPHVIRAQMLTPEQTAAIYTGTTNNFAVRTVNAMPAATPVSGAASGQASGNASGQAATQQSGAAQSGAAQGGGQVSAQPAVTTSSQQSVEGAAKNAMRQMDQQMSGAPPVLLKLQPQEMKVPVGKVFQLKVNLEDGKDVYAVPMKLKYDASRLSLINVDLTGSPNEPNSFLGKDGQAVALVHRDDGNGQVEISTSRPPGVKGVSGSGTVCVLSFKAKAPGDATVAIVRPVIRNSEQQSISAVGSLAVVQVK